MDIHIRKIQIVQDILSLQDEQILKGLENFLSKLRLEKTENKCAKIKPILSSNGSTYSVKI